MHKQKAKKLFFVFFFFLFGVINQESKRARQHFIKFLHKDYAKKLLLDQQSH